MGKRRGWVEVALSFTVLGLATLTASPGPRQADAYALLPLDALIRKLPRVDEEPFVRPGPASAELARRLADGVQPDAEQWRRLLLETGVLRASARWPAGEPFRISLRHPAWLVGHELVLEPLRADVRLASASVGWTSSPIWRCGNDVLQDLARWSDQPLGRIPPGPQTIPLRLELRRRSEAQDQFDRQEVERYLAERRAEMRGSSCAPASAAPRPGPLVVATAVIEVSVDVVPGLDDALPPVSDLDVDAAVVSTLHASFEEWGLEVTAGRGDAADARLAGLARTLEIEVRVDTELHERVVLHPTAASAFPDRTATFRVPSELASDPGLRARWTVRVRGSDHGILHSLGCDRRWVGEVVLPLDELLERGRVEPR